ncbi:MAG TPA: acetyl-CoA carboxylase biotin carboxyl carrier protein subunit [Bdellovibrionales bacterium]|nr:acetyl-CoA carboxylase biotin carboxyl carrier protein subunit [Pseudobdellovibrionaceae bacterium]HAG91414.1 acetyl-CoA carboxylase biotin carboxyl carrier protein subunit [Bdellovibrionales bacterium]|tara:strand:- start:1046 stop:1573 length:528 start_codon:yes stop_codon:yes gene_type:complete
MFFEAESNGKKYQVNVHETKTHWKVSFQSEGEEWKNYEISKEDYRYLDETVSFLFKDSSYLIDVIPKGTEFDVYTRGVYKNFKIYNEETLLHESLKAGGAMGSASNLASGMPGKIVKVFVSAGDVVEEGEPLLIMEAMKMENEMRASHSVKIKEVLVKAGDNVESGAQLITFEPV